MVELFTFLVFMVNTMALIFPPYHHHYHHHHHRCFAKNENVQFYWTLLSQDIERNIVGYKLEITP